MYDFLNQDTLVFVLAAKYFFMHSDYDLFVANYVLGNKYYYPQLL